DLVDGRLAVVLFYDGLHFEHRLSHPYSPLVRRCHRSPFYIYFLRLSANCRTDAHGAEAGRLVRAAKKNKAHQETIPGGLFPLVGATGFEPATSTTPR